VWLCVRPWPVKDEANETTAPILQGSSGIIPTDTQIGTLLLDEIRTAKPSKKCGLIERVKQQ
jgi:hypothetical protein